MTVVCSLFFCLVDTFLSHVIHCSLLQDCYAFLTLLSTYVPHPPVASIVEHQYLNELVHDVINTTEQPCSLDPAGPKYSVLFLLIPSQFISRCARTYTISPL